MTKHLILILTFLIHISVMAQNKTETIVVKKIELDSFSNQMALEMGSKIIELAKTRHQHIAVEIMRLHHTVFYMLTTACQWINTIGLGEKRMWLSDLRKVL